jgi:hypothetical protein
MDSVARLVGHVRSSLSPKSHAYARVDSCMSEHAGRLESGADLWRRAVITVAFSATDANPPPTRKTSPDYSGKRSSPTFSRPGAIRGAKTAP